MYCGFYCSKSSEQKTERIVKMTRASFSASESASIHKAEISYALLHMLLLFVSAEKRSQFPSPAGISVKRSNGRLRRRPPFALSIAAFWTPPNAPVKKSGIFSAQQPEAVQLWHLEHLDVSSFAWNERKTRNSEQKCNSVKILRNTL